MIRLLLALSALVTSPTFAASPPVFDATPVTVRENAGTATFVISKASKATSYSKLRVQTVDGSAKAGVDYKPVDTTLTVANNTLKVSVPISIIDNSTYQGDRTFAVRIGIERNGVLIGSYTPPTVTITDDEVKPVPVSQTVTLGGLAPIADNFDTKLGIEPTGYGPNPVDGSNVGGLPQKSADPVGAFRMTCYAGQLNRDDALVYPGQPNATHLHQYWGNLSTRFDSTYETLRAAGASTCMDESVPAVNRSAYWMPAMLCGDFVCKPDAIQQYYKQRPASDPACKIIALACIGIPDGLSFVYGYNMKTMSGGPTDPNAVEYWMTRYECWKDEAGNVAVPGYFHTIDDAVKAGCPAGAVLIISFVGPACWDGQNVDTPDHRSHMAYQMKPRPGVTDDYGFGCPDDHPYLTPNVSGWMTFPTNADFVAGKWRLSSDDMMSAQMGVRVPAGSTLHFDYKEAWSPSVKATWQKFCIDALKSCASGDLGNGTWMTNRKTPRPQNQVVPVP